MQPGLKHILQGHRGAVYALAYEPGTGLLSGAGDGIIALWDIHSGANRGALAMLPEAVFALCFSPCKRYLLAGTEKGHIHVLDLARKKEIHNLLPIAGKGIFSIGVFDDGTYYALGGDGNLVYISADFEQVYTVPVSGAKLRVAAPDKDMLWLGDSAGNISLYSLPEKRVLEVRRAHDPSVYGLLCTGIYLFSSGRDGHIRKWNRQGGLLWETAAHNYAVYRLLMLPGNILASASRDHKIKFWSADTGSFIQRIDRAGGGHRASVNALLYIPGQKMLVSGSDDKEIKIWHSV